jgi:hypothetical protein
MAGQKTSVQIGGLLQIRPSKDVLMRFYALKADKQKQSTRSISDRELHLEIFLEGLKKFEKRVNRGLSEETKV